MNNSPRGNLRFNRAAVSRTRAHAIAVIPLDPRRSFAPINILSETRRCRFQWKQKLIVSPRRRTEPEGERGSLRWKARGWNRFLHREDLPSALDCKREMSNRYFLSNLRYPFFSRPQKCNEYYSICVTEWCLIKIRFAGDTESLSFKFYDP